MTRDEAIEVLKHTVGNINYDAERKEIYFTDQWVQAYEMAIDAMREREKRSEGCAHCLSEVNKSMMLAHGYACCTDCGRRLEEA